MLSPASRRFGLPYLFSGGDERARTADPLRAKQVLSHLSYTPAILAPCESTSPALSKLYSTSFLSIFLTTFSSLVGLHLRKEVIQPHLPIRLPCYDFTPVIDLTFDGSPLAVRIPASGALNSHGVTGGVYKARERIHRGMLIRDY